MAKPGEKQPSLGFSKFTCEYKGAEWKAYEVKHGAPPFLKAFLKIIGLGLREKAKLVHKVQSANQSAQAITTVGERIRKTITRWRATPSLSEFFKAWGDNPSKETRDLYSELITQVSGNLFIFPVSKAQYEELYKDVYPDPPNKAKGLESDLTGIRPYEERDGKYYYLNVVPGTEEKNVTVEGETHRIICKNVRFEPTNEQIKEIFPQRPAWQRALIDVALFPYYLVNYTAKSLALLVVWADEAWSSSFFKKDDAPWVVTRAAYMLGAAILGAARMAATSLAAPFHYIFSREASEEGTRAGIILGATAAVGAVVAHVFTGFLPVGGLANLLTGGFTAAVGIAVPPLGIAIVGAAIAVYLAFAIGSFVSQLWSQVKGQGRGARIALNSEKFKEYAPGTKPGNIQANERTLALNKRSAESKAEYQRQVAGQQSPDRSTPSSDTDSSVGDANAAGIRLDENDVPMDKLGVKGNDLEPKVSPRQSFEQNPDAHTDTSSTSSDDSFTARLEKNIGSAAKEAEKNVADEGGPGRVRMASRRGTTGASSAAIQAIEKRAAGRSGKDPGEDRPSNAHSGPRTVVAGKNNDNPQEKVKNATQAKAEDQNEQNQDRPGKGPNQGR